MEGWVLLIFLAILYGIFVFIFWIVNNSKKAKKYDELMLKLNSLDRREDELRKNEAEFQEEEDKWEEKIKFDIKAIKTLAKEKSKGFPWLAKAYADYFYLND